MDRERASHDQFSRTTQQKIEHLKDALEERKTAFNSLNAKLSATDAELSLAKQKCRDLDSLVNTLKTELHAEREQRMVIESQHSKEVNKLLEKNKEVENDISNLRRENKSLGQKVHLLETENEKIIADIAEKGKISDQRFQIQLQETENTLQKELSALRQKSIEKSESAKNKLHQLEEERNKLEKEVSNLKSEVVSTKLKADEDLMNCKARLKQEELLRSKQYEERISMLQVSRDDVQTQNTKQLSQLTELQTQSSCVSRECESLKRQANSLKQELEQRDTEHRNEVVHLRTELDNGRKVQHDLRDKISSLEADNIEMSRRHKGALSAKDSEAAFLNEQLRSKENELRRTHEDEMKRADLLEKAIYTYVSSTRSASQPNSPHRN